RTDVGPIARGDANFPVAVATMVPNADGVATKLTQTMEGVRVRFLEMEVNETCDSGTGDDGEFYFNMGINRRAIGQRKDSEYVLAKRGESVPIEASRIFFVEPKEPFNVRIDVNEADDFMNGADDHVGTRSIEYTASELDARGGQTWRSAEIGSGDCQVTVTY